MTHASPIEPAVAASSFLEVTQQIQALAGEGRRQEAVELIAEFRAGNNDDGQNLLLEGLGNYLQENFAAAVEAFGRAEKIITEEQYPDSSSALSIYSAAYIKAQLASARNHRPATETGYRFFKKNIAALGEVDPELAGQVQASAWNNEFCLVNFWGRMHLYCPARQKILLPNEKTMQRLKELVGQREPIAFYGISSGRELGFCLDHPHQGLHGMKRVHYLLENNPQNIKMLLYLRDCSGELLSRELIIFGGSLIDQRLNEVFRTLRFAPPVTNILVDETMRDRVDQIPRLIESCVCPESVRQYYASEEFRRRQREIAAGKVQPRIYVITSRWTTFLKYCAADFSKAFEKLGCTVSFYIEQSDVEAPLEVYHWRQMQDFKPDALFMITHCRLAFNEVPAGLPVIAFLQDRCGKLWQTAQEDLSGLISREDLFICLVKEFQDYLLKKKIDKKQTLIMPVPADEEMFYPLGQDHPLREKFACDISYVKHGNADTDATMAGWLETTGLVKQNKAVADFFQDLYRKFVGDLSRRWPEDKLHELVDEHFGHIQNAEVMHALHLTMTNFSIEVYTACRRRYYLEGLAGQNLSLRLYGRNWHEDRIFSRYAGGQVNRDEELMAVYNFSRINLHMQPYISMHQRLSECGLAGGFMMVSEIPVQQDWSPVQNYFEPGKEIVLFGTKEDLLDKCRYYLAHEAERRQIAENMHQRALRERTVPAAAKTILEHWRSLLPAR